MKLLENQEINVKNVNNLKKRCKKRKLWTQKNDKIGQKPRLINVKYQINQDKNRQKRYKFTRKNRGCYYRTPTFY